MITQKTSLCSAVIAAFALTAGSAFAGDFYWGAEASQDRLTFKPRYYTPDGAPDGAFTNRARGTGVGLLAGHRWVLGPRFSLALEGRLSANDAKWRLQIDEPASFRYSIPFSASLSLQPTFTLSDRIGLYAEAGIATGRIRERKSAPATSAYDESHWRGGTVLGAGINIGLGESWSARLGYRHTRYQELRFSSRAPDGSIVERLRDRPEQKTWHVGLMRSF